MPKKAKPQKRRIFFRIDTCFTPLSVNVNRKWVGSTSVVAANDKYEVAIYLGKLMSRNAGKLHLIDLATRKHGAHWATYLRLSDGETEACCFYLTDETGAPRFR